VSNDDEQAKRDDEARGRDERKRLVGRAGVVGAGTLLSRLLGLVRDVSVAALFTRGQTDAFWVAFTIPNALRQLLAEGAVSSAVVPVLSERLEKGGDEAARAFYARARGVSLLVLTAVSVVGVVLAEPLTELFASGAHATPGQFERTAHLTRVVFPYIFFMGTAALGMAALNAKRQFAVPAFAPALLNVALIGAAFLLPAPLAARGIDASIALGVGALVGGALQMAAQAPALRRAGFAVTPKVDFADPHVREMLRRIAPMTFGIGVYYIDLVLSRRFLSEMGEGAQSYFSWAMRVSDFPQGIFVMAISTAALPSLASLAARGSKIEVARTFSHGLRLSLFVALPASVLLIVLGEPLVALMFQRGKFDAVAAHETARALAWQGGAIFTVAAVRQIVPVYHALGDTRTPVLVSALDLVAFVALALGLRGSLGHVGISVAVAGSSAVQMVLLLAALRYRLGTTMLGEVLPAALRIAAASLVGAAGGWGVARLMQGATAGALGVALPGLAGGAAFAGLFVAAAWGFGCGEIDELAAPIARRLSRKEAT
jgi:putative peptidoglycan lipid II flippase